MKRLYLLRHAKSSWDDSSLDDFERPLAPRGLRDAPRIGRAMRAEGWIPARVISSSSQRTRETLSGLMPELDPAGEIPVDFTDDLYLASARVYARLAVGQSDEVGSLMLVGHNPGIENAAAALAASGDPEALSALHRKYPTGALAVIDFDAERWADLPGVEGRLRHFLRPRTLGDE